MKQILLMITLTLMSSPLTHAGPLRNLIKERITKKLEARPAPEARTDVENPLREAGTYTFTFKHNGLDRYYIVHLPRGFTKGKSYPLLLSLHGGGGNMKLQATDEFYKQISKSDEEGFIAVFPNGFSKLPSGEFATWNAGNCCGDARDKNSDDLGFIKSLLELVKKQVSVDEKRIFAVGMSNGAMMTYRLACEMSDVFRAVSPVAGTDNTILCTPKKPVSILHIHAKDDDHVLFNGGTGEGVKDKTKVTQFVSVPETIKKWVKLNECSTTPKRVFDVKGAFCDSYSPCKSNTEVKLCVTESGRHSWPGGKKPRGNGTPSEVISANDFQWDFFSNLSR